MTQSSLDTSEAVAEAKSNITEYLKSQGYTVTPEAKIRDKSGVQHVFDMLAQRDDGFTTRSITIGFINGGSKDEEANDIFNFANKAYDAGILERMLIVIPELNPDSSKLAGEQRIRVFSQGRKATHRRRQEAG